MLFIGCTMLYHVIPCGMFSSCSLRGSAEDPSTWRRSFEAMKVATRTQAECQVAMSALASNAEWKALLVGGLEHFLFFHILGIIIPTD